METATEGRSRVQLVTIIGAGLAGMTVALELAKAFKRMERPVRIRILERAGRAGGKAGADRVGDWAEDHGFHIFPAWYANTRRLLRDIGCDGNLIDIDRFHHLSRGKFPEIITLKEWSNLPNIIANAFSGLAPLSHAVLSFYFLVDLAAEPFSRRAYLDRVSAAGFLRSRFYATDEVARLHHQGSLQASSIPYYEISAMTMQKMIRGWLWKPKPFVSILNGNLQEKFIEPFRKVLEQSYGVEFLTGHNVVRLQVAPGNRSRVAEVLVKLTSRTQQTKADRRIAEDPDQEQPPVETFYSASALVDCSADDVYVIAVPIDEALELVDDDLYAAERKLFDGSGPDDFIDDRHGLADLIHLQSAPMAAFHVHFRRRLPRIPAEHITLAQSRYGLTLIDVSPHWTELDHTALNCIASHFLPLVNLDRGTAKLLLLRELREYIPFTAEDLGFDCTSDQLDETAKAELERRCYLAPHMREPLFLNTVGAWHYRPDTRTGFDNVFIAGDYCRSNADLTTMESAVGSAYRTSAAILQQLGLPPSVEELPIPAPPRLLLEAARWLAWPIVVPVAAWVKLRKRGVAPH